MHLPPMAWKMHPSLRSALPCRDRTSRPAAAFAYRRPSNVETITSEQPTVSAEETPSMSDADPVVPRRSPLRAAIKTGRPQEWIKNLFVFAGLLFSGKFDQPHEVLE